MSLLDSAERIICEYTDLTQKLKANQNSLSVATSRMDKVLQEQKMIEDLAFAMVEVKSLLSASSIKQCETLANQALQSIFQIDADVHWDIESQRFILLQDGYETDLANSNGGGLVTVISTVFTIYLLCKLGKRKFMAFDEAFGAVSSMYVEGFYSFIRTLCKDLGVDILLVSHDARVTEDMVDHCYLIENGKSKKIK